MAMQVSSSAQSQQAELERRKLQFSGNWSVHAIDLGRTCSQSKSVMTSKGGASRTMIYFKNFARMLHYDFE
jgi:hypothetical protein